MDTTSTDMTRGTWFSHSSSQRIDTDSVISASLKQQYPQLRLTIASQRGTDLMGFAAAGHASVSIVPDSAGHLPSSIQTKGYLPPARRLDDSPGAIESAVSFAKYLYRWNGQEFIVYLIRGATANDAYSVETKYFILSADEQSGDALIMAVGQWANSLHESVWVFDNGFWQKSSDLFRSVMKASWDAVILDVDMKQAIIDDHMSFFGSRETYEDLKVQWKRGIIYHGPPGNGKTISIKATMKMLYQLDDSVPTLYCRTLSSPMGPEYSLQRIFAKARQVAPCYLVFEDLDSIVSDRARSYFLNEVDGIKSNDGIFMVGSTNHLDRLDPGIAKRPSRFDKLYFFPNPSFDERVLYCKFWQSKLSDNDSIDFPDRLCDAIAQITDKFSFAYIQEAFVAALLAIARDQPSSEKKSSAKVGKTAVVMKNLEDDDDWVGVHTQWTGLEDDALEDLVLWIEIQKQVEILRKALEDGGDEQ